MICLSGFIMTTKSGSDCKISHRRSGGSKGEAVEYILDISAQGQAAERCSGPAYQLFLDYAFTQADFFMLAFVNYYGKGLPARARQARAQLAPFRVRSRTNPSWPGTPETCCPNTTYKINVYRCCGGSGLFQGRPMLVLLGRARTDRGLSARDGGRPAVCARKWLGGASLSTAVFRIL